MSDTSKTAAFPLSGVRIDVDYRLLGDERQARDRAEHLMVEQTIEFPLDLVTQPWIREGIVGRIEALKPAGEGAWLVTLSYPVEAVGGELGQLLNVLFGNASLLPGIRVEDVRLPSSLLASFPGPRFGHRGLRERLSVAERPMLCTALKPMGLGPRELGQMAYHFARGGIDVIKDDHSLADQPFCPFHDRVARAAEAVAKANEETGKHCVYAPMVSGPVDKLWDRILFAKALGAGALVVAPGLNGFDLLRRIAADPSIDLPLFCHPAFLGGFVQHPDHGISHGLLFGLLPRLAGADCTIFPSFNGRFSFTQQQCQEIAFRCQQPLGHLRSMMPGPAGGMSVKRVPELLDFYGRDVMLLVGGDLHRASPDLTRNALALLEAVL